MQISNRTVKVHFFVRFLQYFNKMSDSETDSDLAVEQCDVEDDLNAYGSPIFQTVDNIKENLPLEPTTSTRTQLSFWYFLFTAWLVSMVYCCGAKMIIYISSYSFVNVKAPVADELEGKDVVTHVAMSSFIVLKSAPVAQRRLLAYEQKCRIFLE